MSDYTDTREAILAALRINTSNLKWLAARVNRNKPYTNIILGSLREEGLVSREMAGGKYKYRITAAGAALRRTEIIRARDARVREIQEERLWNHQEEIRDEIRASNDELRRAGEEPSDLEDVYTEYQEEYRATRSRAETEADHMCIVCNRSTNGCDRISLDAGDGTPISRIHVECAVEKTLGTRWRAENGITMERAGGEQDREQDINSNKDDAEPHSDSPPKTFAIHPYTRRRSRRAISLKKEECNSEVTEQSGT